MNKEQLQQQSELVIKPINEITGMDFKLFKVDIIHYFFNDDEDIEFIDDDKIQFYFKFKTKSYIIHIKQYSNNNKRYYVSYLKNEGSKWNNNSFRTISELSDFLKQSKFNK
jgi:hypothetical protein